ncbi:MAG: tubulin-like doman-containing protein [Bacteroidaceae bacterium]|nr:tubulin-like doman-containing protein [Bacteroidaceae bacterium]
MAIKLKKTLYVGLGGTGVSTLLKVKKCFVDSYGEVPPMIGFLAIDTDGAASNKSVTSNRGEIIELDPAELLVCTVRGALGVYNANPKTYDWVPSKNVDKLSSIQGGGAGQVRSNGRFIAYYNNQGIKSNIQAVVTKIHQLIPQGSKYEVDTNIGGVEYPANVNVFASIAGGTGSGMLVDVLSIIRDALNQNAQAFKLYPWIVLPEVFRAMNQGPSMANVLYNSYGALRTLDYIMHYDPKTPAINFGYSKVNEPLFDYAYIINNMNQAGVSFNTLDDLIDVVAKSAFLPANKMGDDLASPFDNIVAQKMGGTYDILNKKAWAASASSAELIYDSQAVGRAIAYTTITQLCESMLQSPADGSTDANAFFDDQNVMIRENNGRDDVINALLSPAPIYSLQIDENTTEFDINSYIENNCGQTQLETSLKDALEKKLATTNSYFEKYISEIMSRPQGKVDAALKFMSSLSDIITICKGEMEEEGQNYRALNSVPAQWGAMLNAVKVKGIKSIFGKSIDEEAVEILQNKLVEVVMNRREEIRRSWAIKFYTSFEDTIKKKLQKVESLKAILIQIGKDNTRKLLAEQHESSSKSKFQIFLHEDDVMKASQHSIDDVVKTNFMQFLNGGVSPWLGQSQEYVENKLWSFAKESPSVKLAVNTNIDDILSNLPEEKVKSYLEHLKVLAAPLWTYNTQGFNNTNLQLDRFVIVGVGNRNTSVLSQNKAFNTYFDTNGNKTSFASTNQNDRVYVLVVEDLLPIYAVNNFSSYQRDYEDKIARGFMMANYLDEKLNNRMNSENFNIIPAIETDDVLQYWVWGFVFDYIHYDTADNQYWIRSKSRGDALRKYRFNLSHQRDVAFDIFKSERLYKEVEDGLNRQIAKNGRQPIEDKIADIKAEDSYMERCAQLSPLESSNLTEPNFKAVRDLLAQEIGLMSE